MTSEADDSILRSVLDDLARTQAGNHREEDPLTTKILYFPYEDGVRLLEVTADVTQVQEVDSYRFWCWNYEDWGFSGGGWEEGNMGIPIDVAVVSEEAWQMILDGYLKLPEGWELSTSVEV